MSARRSGSLAGATIAVWKAWLTGSGTTCRPAAVRISMARRTAAVGIHSATCGSVTSPIRSNGGTATVMRSITPKVAITWLLSG